MPLLAVFALAACGGGGTSSPAENSTTPTPTPTATATAAPGNVADVIVDAGPDSLAGNNSDFNAPFVTITLCAPGSTTNCQTIDHVLLDTGSVGLRIIQPVLSATLLAALPLEVAPSGNPVGECYQYITSYVFGSVRQADFKIAGESVAAMPVQVVGDTGAFTAVPDSCSSGAGTQTDTVDSFGANAIIGIGATATDCGIRCQTAGGYSGAIYYDCPTSGCDQIIARNASTVAPFQQLPNPVAAFPLDNNGTIITLPAVAKAGVVSLTGKITFGIGTQANNVLAATHILTLTSSASYYGPGLLTALFDGQTLPVSYLDTGSNVYYFEDSTIPTCGQGDLSGFYCPTSPVDLSPTLTGQNGVSVSGDFTLYNPNDLANTVDVAPGLGINPQLDPKYKNDSQSFAFGLPFYFGRTVYTAIEGANAGGTIGPYVAF